MKIHTPIKFAAALLGSLAIVVAQADAKPGHGKSDKKGHNKHRSSQSHKADEHKGRKHSWKESENQDKNSRPDRFARFRSRDRDEVLYYFSRHRSHRDGLPPGLAMNLRRGKALPAGWQSRLVPGYRINDTEWLSYAPVPSEWFPNQRMEPNTRLYHYGDRVIRVYEPRREVIDVITLPAR